MQVMCDLLNGVDVTWLGYMILVREQDRTYGLVQLRAYRQPWQAWETVNCQSSSQYHY